MANPQNVELGRKYLQQMFTAVSPRNYTFAEMVKALRADGHGGFLSDEDWNDWLDSKGFIIKIAQGMSNRPDQALLSHLKRDLSSNRNLLPTRKSLDSFFISYKYSPSFMDYTKAIASGVKDAVVSTSRGVTTVSKGIFATIGITAKMLPFLVVGAVGVVGYIYWRNRHAIFAAAGDKMVGKLTGGLVTKANPRRRSKKR